MTNKDVAGHSIPLKEMKQFKEKGYATFFIGLFIIWVLYLGSTVVSKQKKIMLY